MCLYEKFFYNHKHKTQIYLETEQKNLVRLYKRCKRYSESFIQILLDYIKKNINIMSKIFIEKFDIIFTFPVYIP